MRITPKKFIFLGFFIRVANSFYNGFIDYSLGAGTDSGSFHYRAANPWYKSDKYEGIFKAESIIPDGGYIYIKFLEVVYNLTTDHLFIGSLVSSIFWYFSALILLRSVNILKIKLDSQNKIFLFYSLLPTSIFFTSIPLREPFQLFFVNLILYSYININYIKSNKNVYWVIAIFAIIMAGSLHYSLLYSGIISFFLLILYIFQKTIKSRLIWFFMSFPTLLIFYFSISYFYNNMYDMGIAEQVMKYQTGLINVENVRAIYRRSVEINNFSDFIIFVPKAFFQYLFEPFPNRISSVMDLLLFFENLIRFYLFYNAISIVKNKKGNNFGLVILLYYTFIEIIWSLGVNNWGTAARHHIPSIGVLCLSSFMHSMDENKKIFSVKRGKEY